MDMKAVFMNPNEFGSWHEVSMLQAPQGGLPAPENGPHQVLLVVDDDELRDRKSSASNPTDGVYDASLLFYAQKADFLLLFGKLPVLKSRLKVDGKSFTVSDVQEDDNMITVTLSSRQS